MQFRPLLFSAFATAFLPSAASFAQARTQTHAGKGTPLASALSEPATLEYLAPAGTVKRGEIVAVLDCSAPAAKLRGAESALEAKRAEAREEEKAAAAAREDQAREMAEAEEAVKDAERALGKYKEGEGPATELALQLALHDAEATWKGQTDRFNARDKLLAKGFIQKVEYDNEEVLLKRATLALEEAKIKLAAFTKYDKEQTTAKLARALAGKKETVEKLKARTTADAAAAKEAAERAEAELRSLQEERDHWAALLKKAVLRAATEGVFTPGDPARTGTGTGLKLRLGDPVAPGQVIGVLGASRGE